MGFYRRRSTLRLLPLPQFKFEILRFFLTLKDVVEKDRVLKHVKKTDRTGGLDRWNQKTCGLKLFNHNFGSTKSEILNKKTLVLKLNSNVEDLR